MLIAKLTEDSRIAHHFTKPYCPWANDLVESICREVLRSCKGLLRRWHLGPREWLRVLECVQSVLNHAPLKRLGLRDKNLPQVFRTPLELFTGHKPTRLLMRALPAKMHENAKSTDEL